MANQIIRTEEELYELLHQNISFLKLSSSSYDNGHVGEAIRLATTVRVLLHDTRNSISLLKHLNLKNSIQYFNTAVPYDPKELGAVKCLVLNQVSSSGSKFIPFLDECREFPWCKNDYLPFDEWWNQNIIRDSTNNLYTRKDIVLTMANKDGGAHVDSKIDESYSELKKGNSINSRFVYEVDGVEIEENVVGLELASMRQIAYELIISIGNSISI